MKNTIEFKHDGYVFHINTKNLMHPTEEHIGHYIDFNGYERPIHRGSVYGFIVERHLIHLVSSKGLHCFIDTRMVSDQEELIGWISNGWEIGTVNRNTNLGQEMQGEFIIGKKWSLLAASMNRASSAPLTWFPPSSQLLDDMIKSLPAITSK